MEYLMFLPDDYCIFKYHTVIVSVTFIFISFHSMLVISFSGFMLFGQTTITDPSTYPS